MLVEFCKGQRQIWNEHISVLSEPNKSVNHRCFYVTEKTQYVKIQICWYLYMQATSENVVYVMFMPTRDSYV